jgi:hypothetical protein
MRLFLLALTLSMLVALPATHADNTVRTGAQGSGTISSVENSRALYTEVVNILEGKTSVMISELESMELRLLELLRHINNIQTVIYTTETVYVEPDPRDFSDDGGGGCG